VSLGFCKGGEGMDVMGIAAASINLKSSQILTSTNIALLGKVLDTAQIQGEVLESMMEVNITPPQSQHLLDVYA